MTLKLPPLPYDKGALEPHISARSLAVHHDKHHATYVANANKLLENTELADAALEEVIKETGRNLPQKQHVFNEAAQVWNHTFFWNSMQPHGGGDPVGDIADQIKQDFGCYTEFRDEFAKAATNQFGSGWTWLTLKDGKLRVLHTHDAEDPLVLGQRPLLTLDVWEHAYYLDYQNRRADFVEAFLDHLVNWDFANRNLLSK